MSELRAIGRRLGGSAASGVRRVAARAVIGRRADRDCVWLLARLRGDVGEQRPPRFGFSSEPRLPALVDLLRALDAARDDARVRGVVLRFEGGAGGLAQAAALRRAVAALRESGKAVWSFAESYDALDLYVASAGERVDLAPTGSLHLLGFRTAQIFGRSLLDKLGVRADVVRIGTHKAAAEPLTRTGMSPEQRDQLGDWQRDAFDALVSALASGRGLAEEAVREAIDQGIFAGRDAVERGLIDGLRYPDEVEAALLEATPDARGSGAGAEVESPPLVDIAAYASLHAADLGWHPLRGGLPRIAYVAARGTIARGRIPHGIASQRYAELFARLRREREVKAVVVRVESGGGDAVASDLLYRAVERLAQEKPVVASLAGIAASGGYYLAAAASAVVAEAQSLTGSIGVVGGKLDLSGLYERLGIRVDAVESGARAGLLSPTRGFTPDERGALQREMRALYEAFVDRVARGRGLAPEAVERVAQGRVMSGLRAHEHGLVDALGGPLEALALACERAGLARGQRYVLDVLPRAVGLASLPWFRASARARVRLD